MNSREKGKRGERQWRDELRAQGYAARRGQQFRGGDGSPDVICDDLPWAHFEVKVVERLNIYDAVEQALRDCGRKVPFVSHRRNHRPWLVTMEAETYFRLLRGDLPQKDPKDARDGRESTPRPSPLPDRGGEGEDNFLRRDAEGGPRDAGETNQQQQPNDRSYTNE